MNPSPKIIGHLNLRSRLSKLATRDIMAHSNIFVGPPGIGKRLVAKDLAYLLLCDHMKSSAASNDSACFDCDSCRLLASGNHPDFYLLECDTVGFNAEQARELLYSINLAPYRAGKRVVILNDADSLSTVVANLLLKTLEEPRKDTFFFLIASNSSRLPIPVVSRCQNWRFSYLSNSEVAEALQGTEDLSIVDTLVEIAGGSLENIKEIETFLPKWQNVKEKLAKIVAGDSYLAMNYASELTKDKEQIAANLSLLRLFIKTQLRKERVPTQQLILADSLENVLQAERLITERNFAPLAILNLCLLGLSGKLPPQGRMLSEIVV